MKIENIKVKGKDGVYILVGTKENGFIVTEGQLGNQEPITTYIKDHEVFENGEKIGTSGDIEILNEKE